MLPTAQLKKPVMLRIRKLTFQKLADIAFEQGLQTGPFCTHVMETIALCPPEKFHAALAAFLDESKRR
jgi:hypothetical protein